MPLGARFGHQLIGIDRWQTDLNHGPVTALVLARHPAMCRTIVTLAGEPFALTKRLAHALAPDGKATLSDIASSYGAGWTRTSDQGIMSPLL